MTYIANKDRYSKMKYRRCGKSGLLLPIVSLGLWHNFGDNANFDNMKAIIFTAFDNGITYFDLANNYGPEYGAAERNFGKIYEMYLKPYRDELIISTKAGYDMWEGPYGDHGSRKYLIASINQSLKRMNLEYVDIFYHHRMDPETPLIETMTALRDIVLQGKALYIGLSNYDGETLVKATELLTKMNVPFIVNQNKYNIFDRTIENNGLLKESINLGKGIVTFSPLEQGLLTSRYLEGVPCDSRAIKDGRYLKKELITSDKIEKIKKLNEIAKSRNETLADMALARDLKDEAVTSCIIGASKKEQILDNIKVINSKPFTKEELLKIDKIVNE